MSTTGLVSALALAVPGWVLASDGTITFNGAVTDTSCTVVVNGGTADGTVTLPTVSTGILNLSGNVAGATNFTLDLSGCDPVGTVNAFFEAGANVDPATGNLTNTGTAANVVVQLFADNDLTQQIKPGLEGQTSATDVIAAAGTLYYVAQYYATDAATAGTFSSTVTYSLTYQ